MKLGIVLIIIKLSYLSLSAQEKYAFIVAISKYDYSTNWKGINSNNDIDLIYPTLLSNGFKKENIFIYGNNERIEGNKIGKTKLTKEVILKSIKEHLFDPIDSGDIVFFHFSGHGQQIADDNGDEWDGLDESLVPEDAPMKNYTVSDKSIKLIYNREKHLRDDELDSIFTKIREKLGPKGSVFVSIDACFSGTSTREYGTSRGSLIANVPDGWNYTPPNIDLSESKNTFFGKFKYHSEYGYLAPMACFFASQANEQNYEFKFQDKYVGPLSLALSKSLAINNNLTTYKMLFSRISEYMRLTSPNQRPMAEGDLDHYVFSRETGNRSTQNTFSIISNNNKTIKINGGYLHGINPGTMLGFYTEDVFDISNSKSIYRARVDSVSIFESIALIENHDSINIDSLKMLKLFIIEKSLGSEQLKLDIKLTESKFKDKLLSFLQDSFEGGAVSNVDSDLIIDIEYDHTTNDSFLVLYTSFDALIGKFDIDNPNIFYEILESILEYQRIAILKKVVFGNNMNSENINYGGNISVDEKDNIINLENDQNKVFLNFQAKTNYTINLKNTGKKTSNFAILQVAPNNKLTNFAPLNSDQVQQFKLSPNKIRKITFSTDTITGVYHFIIFASNDELHLYDILNDKNMSQRSNNYSIGRILSETFKHKGRFRSKVNFSENLGFFYFTFNVIPKKIGIKCIDAINIISQNDNIDLQTRMNDRLKLIFVADSAYSNKFAFEAQSNSCSFKIEYEIKRKNINLNVIVYSMEDEIKIAYKFKIAELNAGIDTILKDILEKLN